MDESQNLMYGITVFLEFGIISCLKNLFGIFFSTLINFRAFLLDVIPRILIFLSTEAIIFICIFHLVI